MLARMLAESMVSVVVLCLPIMSQIEIDLLQISSIKGELLYG